MEKTMIRLEIIGKDIDIPSKTTRIGARALIERDGKYLFSYLSKRNQYLTPGGGIDEGESILDAVKRECIEECGIDVEPEEPFLVVDEYYFEKHWVNYYSICSIKGRCNGRLDKKEVELELTPTWVDEDKLKDIFSNEMNWDDIYNGPKSSIYAVRNSHYREYCVYLISKGLDIPPIPDNIKDYIKSIKVEKM